MSREAVVDPYKNYKFRIKWQGRHVAGISRVGALRRTTEVVRHTEGGAVGSQRKSPGRTDYEAITLERGVTHDSEFEAWANQVWTLRPGDEPTADFRRDLRIEVYDETGRLAIAYDVFRCWVSEYQALPELDAAGNAIAIEHIKVENEGWERDRSVSAATGP
jgi:phage tail-like protein